MSLEKYNSSKEMLDDYMAYKISTEDNDTSSYSGSYSKKNSGSVLGGIIGAVIVLFVIAAIISAFQPKCAKPGCDNTVEHRDDYCALHDNRSVFFVEIFHSDDLIYIYNNHKVNCFDYNKSDCKKDYYYEKIRPV